MIVSLNVAFRKKLEKVSKEKNCELIGEWKKSLVNHLYWSAVSTADGNGEMIRAKWLSVDNHIHNKHRGHSKIFPVCKHKLLGRRARRKKWFKPRKCSYVPARMLVTSCVCVCVQTQRPVRGSVL